MKNNIEFRVGITIIIALILVAVSLYWLQGYKLERNSRQVQVRFSDVGNLSIGDRVAVSGVHKGKVNKLFLGEGGVIVELLVYQDVDLRRDATFRVRNQGVMGERYIAIDPGKDSLAFDYDVTVDGLYDTGIPEVMGALGEAVKDLRVMVKSIRRTIASDSSLSRFDRTVSNLESASKSLAGFMSRNRGKMDETAEQFARAARDINRMVSVNSDRVDSTMVKFERSADGLELFVNRLDTLSSATRRLARAIEEEDGTLQLLLEDRRLYDDLRQTADNLDDLINDIRENPRKYINLKVEIF